MLRSPYDTPVVADGHERAPHTLLGPGRPAAPRPYDGAGLARLTSRHRVVYLSRLGWRVSAVVELVGPPEGSVRRYMADAA